MDKGPTVNQRDELETENSNNGHVYRNFTEKPTNVHNKYEFIKKTHEYAHKVTKLSNINKK